MNSPYSTAVSTDLELDEDMSFVIPTRKGEAIGGIPWRLPVRSHTTPRREAATSAHETAAHDISAHDGCEAVERALSDSRWDFRTVKGIAEETGLAADTVKHLLEEHQLARTPWGRMEDNRYTARDRPVSLRERLSLLVSYVAKRPR